MLIEPMTADETNYIVPFEPIIGETMIIDECDIDEEDEFCVDTWTKTLNVIKQDNSIDLVDFHEDTSQLD